MKTKIWITKIGSAFCSSYLISKALFKLFIHSWHSSVTATARQQPTESQSTCHTNKPDMILPSHLGNNALLMLPSTSSVLHKNKNRVALPLLVTADQGWPLLTSSVHHLSELVDIWLLLELKSHLRGGPDMFAFWTFFFFWQCVSKEHISPRFYLNCRQEGLPLEMWGGEQAMHIES